MEDFVSSELCLIAIEQDNEVKGYEVHRSRVVFKFCEDLSDLQSCKTDSDGDQVVRRDAVKKEVLSINHALRTSVSDVGLQLWAGCFLLCDFLLSNPPQDQNVLELGAGLGVASIISAMSAKTVIVTDIGEDVLSMCNCNLKAHQHLYSEAFKGLFVKELNWLNGISSFMQSCNADENNILQNVDLIIASDVVYDVELTKAFLKIVEMMFNITTCKTIIITLEKRLNFTCKELEVCCPAYNRFLQGLKDMSENKQLRCSVKQIDLSSVPQLFESYKRNEFMEIWQILH